MVKRQRRSVPLTAEEFTAFKSWVSSFPTLQDAYEDLGVSKGTLDRLILAGSGHPNTIAKVKDKIGSCVNA